MLVLLVLVEHLIDAMQFAFVEKKWEKRWEEEMTVLRFSENECLANLQHVVCFACCL